MSFNVKFIYDLVDKLSPALKTINKNIESSNQSVLRLGRSLRSSLDNFSYDKFVGVSKVALRSIGRDIDKLSEKSKQLGKEYFFKASIPLSLLGAKFIKTASDYQESLNKVILVIVKQMKGKKRNVCFESYGQVSKQILNFRYGERIKVYFTIDSVLNSSRWYHTLKVVEVEKEIKKKKIENINQTNLLNYDTTEKGFD